MPYWDSYFPGWFQNTWVNNGHIRYARWVGQWNAMGLNDGFKGEYEKWVSDAGGMGLILDLAVTNYFMPEECLEEKKGGKIDCYPESISQYQAELKALLAEAEDLGHPIRYVEAWNEPNGQGHGPGKLKITAQLSAEFTNAAYKTCEAQASRCTIVAGNFVDTPRFEEYEEEYEAYLSPTPSIWGFHPYGAAEEKLAVKEDTSVWRFQQNLPNKGSGDQIWFTEVGAYQCGTSGESRGETQQALDADYLVNSLMPWFGPEHVFYYEFDYKAHELPPCRQGEPDTALYIPSSGSEVSDAPRPAASFIYDNKASPWAYTEGVEGVYKHEAEMRGTVYTGGFFETEYYFQYGTTTSYGMTAPSPGAKVGWEKGLHWAYGSAKSLIPDTTYHYRLVAHNAEGTYEGVDKTFTTELAPPNADTWSGYNVTRTSATLEGEVMPDSLSTEYWFDYKEVGGSEQETVKHTLPYTDESWHEVDVPVTTLKSCSVYEVTLVVKNADGEKRAPNTEVFPTECWPPSVKSEAAQEIKRAGATLEGEVYPNGLPTKYWFEYGHKGAFESKTSVTEAGSSRAWYMEHATISSFEPCKEYQFRIVAENEDSWDGPPKGVVDGETEYLATRCKPVIKSVHVTHLEPGSAVLEAEVNPEEAETESHFEYDMREYKQGESAHGTSVPIPEVSVGSGTAFVKVSRAVVKLEPGRAYYFQAVAHNVSGQTTSEASFNTPMGWELNSKIVTSSASMGSEGTLVLESLGVSSECTLKGEGVLSGEGHGEIKKLTGSKGESVVSCHIVKQGGLFGTSCEGATAEVEAVHLPWSSELVDEPVKNEKGEVVSYHVRLRFHGASGDEPGWVLKCKYGSGAKTRIYTCVGELTGNLEDVSSGVPFEFDSKSPHPSCSGNTPLGEVSGLPGVIEGGMVFQSTEAGKTLGVYGAPSGPVAPNVVTGEATGVANTEATLNGTVAAKDVATTYQFEYGPTTVYGKKFPVSPASVGEGRTRLEVAQTLTGLEPSVLYHYRIAATNSAGTSYGEDRTFTTGYPAKWELNGKTTELAVSKGEGTLVLESLGVTVECVVAESGYAALLSNKVGTIEKVTGSKGESVVSCHIVKQGGLFGTSCEGATAEVEAVHLPWSSELVDEPVKNEKGEVVSYHVRLRFHGASGDEPGWVLKCKYGSGAKTRIYTCVGELTGNLEDVSSGVPFEFDSKSPHPSCSGNTPLGEVSGLPGVIEGGMVFQSTESGKTLGVYGAPSGPLAPNVVTGEATNLVGTEATLNGTVAAKGVATTYQFEYGPTTAYGKRFPVSPASVGEGRTRVEVAQTLTGLEPSVLYHYRVVAINGAGTSYGEDRTFTTGYPAKWELNGKTTELAVSKGEGTLVLESLGVTVECVVAESGYAALLSNKVGTIEKVTGSKGESVVSCHIVKQGGLFGTSCEGATAEVEAVHLPWSSELVDEPVKNEKGEVVSYHVRLRFHGASGDEPGWVLKCKYGSGAKTRIYTCVGELTGNLEDVSSGVPFEFDSKSPHPSCSGNTPLGEVSGLPGVIEGGMVFQSTEAGKTLGVYGAPSGPVAPNVVTGEATGVANTEATLNGTVAAKDVATTYQFEYGPTTVYGKKFPVSPASVGEGRTRLEVAQTLTGLEPSVLYHYRIAATNSAGTSYGEDRTFTTGYPAKWELNGKTTELAVSKGEGTLVLESLGVTVECVVAESGYAALLSNKVGTIEKVTGSKGESVVSCHIVKQGGLFGTSCEGATAEVEAVHLPWSSELVDEPVKNEKGEVVSYHVRLRFHGASGDEPGWVLKCKYGSGAKTRIYTCVGELTGNLEDVSSGVPFEFDSKSPHPSCSGNTPLGETSGIPGAIEGAVVLESTESGKTLGVYGAPSGPLAPDVVTDEATGISGTEATLNGTVAAKGVATTYQFEYGPTTSYGSKFPVPAASAGEGRTRAEITKTLTGLEPSVLYHYRIAATNSAGTSYGEDKTFTTSATRWLMGSEEPSLSEIKGEGTLILEDPGLGVTAECAVKETILVGSFYGKGKGEVETVTGAKGETKFGCHAIEQGWCGAAPIEVDATSLPWKTQLVDEPVKNERGEIVRHEIGNRFYGITTPGWQISCELFGSIATDTCTGEPSDNVENTTTGVPLEFDSGSTGLSCMGSAVSTGTIEGALMLTSVEGGTLSVYDAPTGPRAPAVNTRSATGLTNSTATLNGTVAAKGIATTYQFEYGTTTSYGNKIPLSPSSAGEGRTRIEISQALNGLTASTIYHYRLTATNSTGTSHGEDKTFTTR